MNIKEFFKHNWLTIILALGTLILAIGTIAIIFKLKQLGTQRVAPNAPQSRSSAQAGKCISRKGSCYLTFSVPTPTPTVQCGQETCQSDSNCSQLPYKVCADIASDNTSQKKCVINAKWYDGCTPPGPTPTPAPCGVRICGTNNDCADLDYKVCADIGSDNTSQKKCVTNGDWFDGCTPPKATPTPTPTPVKTVTNLKSPTPTPLSLPSAGSSGTLTLGIGSIILATLGLALLF